jgi:hypothetical protein
MKSSRFVRGCLALVAAFSLSVLVAPTASAEPGGQIAHGVTYHSFTMSTSHGSVVGYVVTANLRDPRVELDLLHPAAVGSRSGVAEMVTAQRAVAGVNGDFFNIGETHAGVVPTDSAVGPEIADGEDLKAAVPDGQRFGPAMSVGATTKSVFGMGKDRRLRLSSLELAGVARTTRGTFDLEGLNQYAIAVGGIGEYTSEWGPVSRARAACGTDTVRAAPCSTDTEEVVVRHGRVVSESATLGAGQIPRDTTVLVGREAGAAELRTLAPGDRVDIHSRLIAAEAPPFEFAVGGFPILKAGKPLSDLDATTLAPRTAAGASADGRTAYLVTVDGRLAGSTGMTVAELADLLGSMGASIAVNVDGGGSSTIAVREPGQPAATIKNLPSDGSERPVANGIGVFSRG